MNKSPKAAFSLLIPAVIFVAAGAAIFAFQNFSNKRVLSGFAGYVYSKPIFGQNRFEGILIGPSSTGWAWRKEVSKVSITPDTTVEEFDARNGGAILGKDKLPHLLQSFSGLPAGPVPGKGIHGRLRRHRPKLRPQR